MEWKKHDNLTICFLPTAFNKSGEVLASIYPPHQGEPNYRLVMNGYIFPHKSLEDAKEDAVDRATNNKGIYLQYYL